MESDVPHAFLHIVLIGIVITYGHFKEQYGVYLIMMLLELNRNRVKQVLGKLSWYLYRTKLRYYGSEVIKVIGWEDILSNYWKLIV